MTPSAPAIEGYRQRTAYLGMVIFISAWAMLFAALFFAYGSLRVGAHSWPPSDLPTLPRGLPGLATLALALSSVALRRASADARPTRAFGTRVDAQPSFGTSAALTATTALGMLFLALQAVLWRRLLGAGLQLQSSTYASVFYAFTVFHALHVVIGVGAMAGLTLTSLRARGVSATSLRLWTLYWHSVGAVWLLMYVTLFWI